MESHNIETLVTQVRMLPPGGAERNVLLRRLVDRYAVADAEAALQAAAGRTDAGSATDLLAAARDARSAGRDDLERLTEDAAVLDRLHQAVVSPAFRSLLPGWIREMREIAAERPDTGACMLATALQLWSWTIGHFESGRGEAGDSTRQVVAELAEALCPVLAARAFVLEIAGRAPGARAETGHRADLCHVYAAHATTALGGTCAELVFGYRRHLVWDAEGCAICYGGDELDELEGLIPGIAMTARAVTDVVEADGSHAVKAGPCVRFDGLETFTHLRTRLDGCLSGARLAQQRAAVALGQPAGAPEARPAASTGGQ